MVLDETHTQVCGYGGLKGRWKVRADGIVLGKMIGGGIPLGAYGTRSLRTSIATVSYTVYMIPLLMQKSLLLF